MAATMDVIMAGQFKVPNDLVTYPTYAERKFKNRWTEFLDNWFVHVLRGLLVA